MSEKKPVVAVIGAGPAGIYGASYLADKGFDVILLNRDVKPGGLAEYGIYWDKFKMKSGLRKQFRKIMDNPNIRYRGQVVVGENADMSLKDLLEMGVTAVLVTVGAQGTKWLGLPGESNKGVYHAKDIVYHYNKLPPYSQQEFHIGDRVAVIGVGNVMMDMVHWLTRHRPVKEVIAVARRDPGAVKFTRKEMQIVAGNLDLEALDVEIARCAPVMEAVGGDVDAAKTFILSAMPKGEPAVADTRFRFEFLSSPKEIVGNEEGVVTGLMVEDTTLKLKDDGSTSARGLGTTRILDVETVIFAIGDTVDVDFGLPTKWSEFVKNPNPRFPMDELSYETFDPEAGAIIENVFVAGWSREASSGLVGSARKDGINGANVVEQYLGTVTPAVDAAVVLERLEARLATLNKRVFTKEDWLRLEEVEAAKAVELGENEFKFDSNEAMEAVVDAVPTA